MNSRLCVVVVRADLLSLRRWFAIRAAFGAVHVGAWCCAASLLASATQPQRLFISSAVLISLSLHLSLSLSFCTSLKASHIPPPFCIGYKTRPSPPPSQQLRSRGNYPSSASKHFRPHNLQVSSRTLHLAQHASHRKSTCVLLIAIPLPSTANSSTFALLQNRLPAHTDAYNASLS